MSQSNIIYEKKRERIELSESAGSLLYAKRRLLFKNKNAKECKLNFKELFVFDVIKGKHLIIGDGHNYVMLRNIPKTDIENIDNTLSKEGAVFNDEDVMAFPDKKHHFFTWGNYISYYLIGCFSRINRFVTMATDDVLYFDEKGNRAKEVVFGNIQPMILRGLSKEQVSSLRKRLEDRGGQIKESGISFYSKRFSSLWDFIKPWKWFGYKPSSISCNDNGVVFKRQGNKETKTSFVPYDSIYCYFEKKNMLSSKPNVLGEQNIVSKHGFSKSDVSKMIETIKQHVKIDENTVVLQRSFMYSLVHFNFSKRDKIIVSDKGCTFVPAKGSKIGNLSVDRILSARGKGLFSKNIVISGNNNNIRYDEVARAMYFGNIGDVKLKKEEQGADIIMALKGVSWSRWSDAKTKLKME